VTQELAANRGMEDNAGWRSSDLKKKFGGIHTDRQTSVTHTISSAMLQASSGAKNPENPNRNLAKMSH